MFKSVLRRSASCDGIHGGINKTRAADR